MRKTIVATLLALSLCPITNGSDINRVRKYIGDHGQSNAVYMVDFGLRDDSDGKGSYIDLWTYTNIAKPTIAQCPSDEVSDAWASMMAQYNKTMTMKVVDNKFLSMCDILTGGTNHAKLGFAELGVIIEGMTNQNEMVMVTLQLLTIDAQAKREGGLLWWDDCAWHPEAVMYMMAAPKKVKGKNPVGGAK